MVRSQEEGSEDTCDGQSEGGPKVHPDPGLSLKQRELSRENSHGTRCGCNITKEPGAWRNGRSIGH